MNASQSDESFVPFSRCALWQRQRSFFEQQGVNAWSGLVPFYITSNPYLADTYATLILRFLQDARARGLVAPHERAYVLELGAGSGAFSFHLLRRLQTLRQSSSILGGELCYVMSDFCEANVAAFESHPALAPFREEGFLDFARFDFERDESVRLRRSGFELGGPGSPGAIVPAVVIANYVFDSIPHDLFAARDGRATELLVRREFRVETQGEVNGLLDPATWLDQTSPVEVPPERYALPALDAVLHETAAALGSGPFFFTANVLAGIWKLCGGGSRPLLVLAADKGMTRPDERDGVGRLTLGLHGDSVSLLLDFSSLERLARRTGGEAYLHATEGIVTSLYTFGTALAELPETALAVRQFLGTFNPGHLYDVLTYFSDTKPRARLETLVALLELTQWDPWVFDRFFDVILASLPYAKGYAVERLVESTGRIAESFYFIPNATDTLFNLAILLQELQQYEAALVQYQASARYFGETDSTLYNMGLCCYSLGRLDEAVQHFERTIEHSSNHIKARGWISQIAYEREKATVVEAG